MSLYVILIPQLKAPQSVIFLTNSIRAHGYESFFANEEQEHGVRVLGAHTSVDRTRQI